MSGLKPVSVFGGHIHAHPVGAQHQSAEIGIFGEQNVAQTRDFISLHFGYGYSTFDLPSSTTGTGSVSVVDSTLVVSGGDGSASATTRRKVLYRPGHTIVAGGTASFTGTGSGTIGLYNDDYGFRWGVNLDTGVPFFTREFNGTPVTENSTVDFVGLGFDWSKLQLWRVKYGYYGVAPAVFEFMIPGTFRWVTAHEFHTHGVLTTPHTFPNLPVRVEATAGCTVRTASFQAGTYGGDAEVGFRQFAADDWVLVGDTGVETAVAVFRSAPTFNGKTNGILSRLLKAIYASDLEGVGVIRIYRNATLNEGTAVWVDVSAGESVIQMATVASSTPTVGTGTLLDAQYVAVGAVPGAGATTSGGDASFQQIDLWAGENAVITMQRLSGTTAYSVGYGVSWREYQ